MNIGIVDDKEEDLDIYSELLQKKLKDNDEIYCFTNPDDVKTKTHEMDVVFMDVQMPEQDGISLAKELLEDNPELVMVFLSDYDSYVWESFSVDAIYYMRKRYFEKEISQVIGQIERKVQKRQNEYITLREGNKVHHLNVRNIIYIEAQQKNISIKMKDEEVILKYKISMVEKNLKDYRFMKIHRSYLVNPMYIKSLLDREVILENGEHIPVSKYRTDEIKEEYLSYLKELV